MQDATQTMFARQQKIHHSSRRSPRGAAVFSLRRGSEEQVDPFCVRWYILCAMVHGWGEAPKKSSEAWSAGENTENQNTENQNTENQKRKTAKKKTETHFSIVRLSPACACFVSRSTPTNTTTATHAQKRNVQGVVGRAKRDGGESDRALGMWEARKAG